MGNVDLFRKVESLQQQLKTVHADPSSPGGQLEALLSEAVDTLETALEELQIAKDKLEQHAEEMTTARYSAASERQPLETRLQAHETRFQQLLEATEQYSYTVSMEQGRAVTTLHNPGCLAITGYTPQEYEADPALWYRMIHEEDRSIVEEQIAKISTGQTTPPLEHRLIHKDGSIRWVKSAWVPQYDGQNKLVAYDGLMTDITGREQVARALQESEIKFRTLADTTTAAIFIYQGPRIIYVNPAAITLTGYPETELLAMDFWEVIHPEFREYIRQTGLAQLQGAPVATRYELKLLTKDGAARWIAADVELIEMNGQRAVLGTAFDLTRVKQAELELERLLARERRQRLSAETLGEVYLVLTAQVSYEAVLDEILNQVQQLVPYSAANLMLVDGYTLRPARWQGYESLGSTMPAQSLIDLPLDRKAVRTRQPVLVSDTQHDPDWVVMPKTAWIRSFMAVPIYLRDHVLALLRLDSDLPDNFSVEDIQTLVPLANAVALALQNARLHDQARREIEEREQLAKELRRVAIRTHTILDAIPDSMLFFSREGQLLDCRVTDERLVILKPAGAPEDEVQLEGMLPPDLLHQIRTRLANMPSSAARPIFEYQLFSPLGLQDYEVRLVVSSVNEAIAIIRNISERKRVEREAVRTERLAALGRLAAAVAHEINNPLQVIQSNLDLMLAYPSEMVNNEEYLAIIRRQINRLRGLTDQVLNLGRPRPSLRQPVHIVGLMQEVLDLTHKLLQQHHVQLIFEAQQVPPVVAVPHQLSQVFLNLVINAVEAMPDQGRLQVAIYPVEQEVVISFTSDSPAIPPDILPHIFDPFFTTKAEGSGLGLWICHNLIEQNQGSLTVQNLTRPPGVAFTVKLPLAPAGS